MALHQVSKKRIGVNKDVETQRMRATNGTYTKVFRGNYRNSSEMKKSEKAQRFGGHNAKYLSLIHI